MYKSYLKWLGMLLPGCESVVLRESHELPGCEFCDVELLLLLQPRTRLSYCADGISSLIDFSDCIAHAWRQ